MTFRTQRRSAELFRWAAALLLLLLLAWTRRADAQMEQPPRVLLIAPAQAELTARILGQTRDLGATLEVISQRGLEAGPEAAREAASLGETYAAEIVVWTEARGGAGLDVHVLVVASGELRTRRVSTPQKEALASSTTAEMGALVVRSELSTLLSELRAARERERAQAESASTAPASETQPAPPPRVQEHKLPSAAPVARPWSVALAYRPSRPFRTTFAHGLALGVRRDLSGFALGVTAIGTLPIRLSKASTEIRLNRLQIRLEGLKRFQTTPTLSILLGAAAGLSIDFRSTEEVEAPMVRTGDAATLSGGFGLIGQLEWMFSERVGGTVGLGADAVPWRTRFVYEDGGGGGTVARLSWLDVWALVGFFTRFGA